MQRSSAEVDVAKTLNVKVVARRQTFANVHLVARDSCPSRLIELAFPMKDWKIQMQITKLSGPSSFVVAGKGSFSGIIHQQCILSGSEITEIR